MGKYRIDRVIGRGGIGLVLKAHHLHLNEPVAIKVLLPRSAADDEVVRRFQREAQAVVKLKSEHVCRVQDIGRLDNGAPYMVMEYMAGYDLRYMLKKHQRLDARISVDFIIQACAALGEAHALGIIHRDIKPGNLFIAQRHDGSPMLKILDFGISKVENTSGEEITHADTVLGTPAYMSPEQMRAPRTVDSRTDIWSLGVVLYELIGGTRPFRGQSFSDLCIKIVSEPVPPIPVSVSPGLHEAVMRALRKDREARYQNVAEMSAAFAPFSGDQSQAVSLSQRTSRALQVPVLPPDKLTGSHASINTPISQISQISQISVISESNLISENTPISQSGASLDSSSGAYAPPNPDTGSHPSLEQPLLDSSPFSGDGSTLGEGRGQVVVAAEKPRRRRALFIASLLLLVLAGAAFIVLSGPKTGSTKKSVAPAAQVDAPPLADRDRRGERDKMTGTSATVDGENSGISIKVRVSDPSDRTTSDPKPGLEASAQSDGKAGDTTADKSPEDANDKPLDKVDDQNDGKTDVKTSAADSTTTRKTTKKKTSRKTVKNKRKQNETSDDDDILDSRN